jgi:predicted nucleotidyltransferase component of viral defense system
MPPISEHRDCYVSATQREVLIDLLRNGVVSDNYFLTGGTALSVFYLHHRRSNDLDFFTRQQSDLSGIDFTIRTLWGSDYVRTKSSETFLSLLIKGIRVEFVVDRLSLDEERERVALDSLHSLRVDTPNNIASNKLCTLASRTEPKDFVDYYALCKTLKIENHDRIFADAKGKDRIFEDPPTAAYQIEQGLEFLRRHPDTIPELLVPLDKKDLADFYSSLVRWMFSLTTEKL